jgi:hypothetical protein
VVLVPLSPGDSRCAPPSAFGGHDPVSGIVYGLRSATVPGCGTVNVSEVILVQKAAGLPGKEVHFYEDLLTPIRHLTYFFNSDVLRKMATCRIHRFQVPV